MACGCSSDMGCDCTLQAGSGIQIVGLGTAGEPFVITNSRPTTGVADTPSLDLTLANTIISGMVRLAPLFSVVDTPTLRLVLNGAGTESSPFVLSGALAGIVLEPAANGDVMTRKPDGSWGPGPATQAPAGAVTSANGLSGDGSGGNPVRISAMTYADFEAVVDNAGF